MDERTDQTLSELAPAQIREYGIVALDAEGRVVSWNAGAERVTGYADRDVVGREASFLLPAGDEARFAEWLDPSGSMEGVQRELWLRRADGTAFWAGIALNAVVSEGERVGFGLVIADFTGEKRDEEQLRVSHAMFEGILAIASDAVVCIDASYRIFFFNQGAERIFGYAPREVLGQPLEILIPTRSRAGHSRQIDGFAKSPVVSRQMGERGEIAGQRRNGEVFPAEASISKLEVGGTHVFTAVLRDITDRKAAQEALARQAAELTRSNKELEQFAYVASHDLQEPLRMIGSYTQLLARRYGEKLDEDAREFIGFAVDGVTRMQALINDLLAYSRVGTREVTLEPVDMELVLERVLLTLEPRVVATGGTVENDPLPTVTGDHVQLSQLLQNLVQNAIKFSRPGVPPEVRVTARAEPREWVFGVADNGIGIAPEFRDRIFALFQRLHNREEYDGTGIGLAICQKIVERHGGRIWVEGAPGQGSTFYFTLPRRGAEDDGNA